MTTKLFFYCIDCEKDIEYTPKSEKAVESIIIAHAEHKETCVNISASFSNEDKIRYLVDKIERLAEKK